MAPPAILLYIKIAIAIVFIVGSVWFVPCEYVMLGLADDPSLKKTLYPIALTTFIYKDILVLAIIVYVVLIFLKLDPPKGYDIAMCAASAIGVVLNIFGYYRIYHNIGTVLKKYGQKNFIGFNDPLFYDGLISMLLFILCFVYIILRFILPNEGKSIKYAKMTELRNQKDMTK